VKRLIIRYLVVLTIFILPVKNTYVFSNSITAESVSTTINNSLPEDNSLILFLEESDSCPVKHCEIVEPPVIPSPFSGNTRIKCLNTYNLQVLVYTGTNHKLLSKSAIRRAIVKNISQLLNILQI